MRGSVCFKSDRTEKMLTNDLYGDMVNYINNEPTNKKGVKGIE